MWSEMSKYELLICEKPSQALKLATALADGKVTKKKYFKTIPAYEITHDGKELVVACAAGHLYTVAEKVKKGWTYPVFEVEWKPSFEASRGAKYLEPYVKTIKNLSENADKFTVATDYDIEGEVIGYNVIRFTCGQKDARRMKFSTTTKEDLQEAYEHAQPHIDWLQAEAGLTRHELDFYYGINLSRALSLAIKAATNGFKILSSGRVQGPTLKILADRELEIKNFKPEPFWQLELETKELTAWHKEDKFWDKKKADDAYSNANNKKPVVKEITKTQFNQMPPHPFDLTALQLESYKQFGISPKVTQEITQDLYINSYISYPRTSSDQLPESVNYRKLIEKISRIESYTELCKELLSKKGLKPNNGKKVDPAHPACHPTGEYSKDLSGNEAKVYDLIVRRTLASFAEPAKRETVKMSVDCGGEEFLAEGTRTIEKGWHNFYGKYAKFEEQQLPKLDKNQELKFKQLTMHDKETQPPKRYTPASIIKELEKKNLGTKSTRANIIENLYHRNYVEEKSLQVTDLGLRTVDTLQKYCPEILDEALTRQFEDDMELIREKKKKGEQILEEARAMLTKILAKFKKHEKEIGGELAQANRETVDSQSIVGKCKKCGKDLRILYSKRFKSRFVACSGYPDCKTTFSLPQGLPKITEKTCPDCGYPMVMVIRAGKRPFDYCIYKECPKKVEWRKQQELKKQEATPSSKS